MSSPIEGAALPTQRYLISTLAQYQTDFWLLVGQELRRLGHDVAFVSFDDRSTEALRALDFVVFSLSESAEATDVSDAAMEVAMQRYQMRDLNYWTSHERFAFGLRDGAELRRKLLRALALADQACRQWGREGNATCMVQELGGFLSVVACFFAARGHAMTNWFIEPAFFKGRLFFLQNTFAALPVRPRRDVAVSTAVRDYLEVARRDGTVVIPQKDRHHYAPALKKIVNMRNLRRLFGKMADKYIGGKRQEFGYISRHVGMHLNMVLNSYRLRSRYTPLEQLGPFVYYPLHVPGDMALTLRSPQYLDQLSLIDYLARSLPHSHQLVIKEHPAMMGAIDIGRLDSLLERYDNLHLIAAHVNNYRLMTAADAVVSVNSKSGAEAMLLGKPVIVLGDAFYTHSPFVCHVDRLTDVGESLRSVVGKTRHVPELGEVDRYFAAVWQQSLPGELYVTQPEQVAVFVRSLIDATRLRATPTATPMGGATASAL